MFKHRRGSLTVEAVLILPIFMAAILFISYFIKAHLVQDIVQDALTEAVVEVSALSYPYSLSGAKGLMNAINDDNDSRIKALAEHFEEVSLIIETVQKPATSELEEAEESSLLRRVTPVEMFRLAKGLAAGNTMEMAEDAITEQLILGTMGELLTAKDGNVITRMDALGIEGGLDGLDFTGSEFYCDGGILDVQVQYKLTKVDPFGFIDGVLLKNRAVCRAWMGGIDHDNDGGISRVIVPPIREGNEDDQKDVNRVYRTCYVIADSEGASKYHFYECSSLRLREDASKFKTVIPVRVEFVKQGDIWVPEGSVIYRGKTYEFCMNCKAGRLRMREGNGEEH